MNSLRNSGFCLGLVVGIAGTLAFLALNGCGSLPTRTYPEHDFKVIERGFSMTDPASALLRRSDQPLERPRMVMRSISFDDVRIRTPDRPGHTVTYKSNHSAVLVSHEAIGRTKNGDLILRGSGNLSNDWYPVSRKMYVGVSVTIEEYAEILEARRQASLLAAQP